LLSIAAVILFLAIAVPMAGWAASLVSAYIITLGGITATLYALPESTVHYGIAPSAPRVSLGDVLLVGALLAIWAQKGRLEIRWLVVAFAVPALVLLLAVWADTPEQWSGLKLYLTAIVSFGIGRWLSENLTDRAAFVLVSACFAVCALQFIITFVQSRGLTLLTGTLDTAQWINEGRMVGLYNHPATLGKSMFLLFCFLLPLSAYRQRTTRRLAFSAIALGSAATLLTLSRANIFAIGAAVVLWLILSGRASSMWTKLAIVVAMGLVMLLNADIISRLELRQLQDPEGGARQYVLSIGMHQIHSAPFSGTGPNYYVEIVGRYDGFAAKGFPVHNSFLLPVAELGIPLAIIFFLPLLIVLRQVARRISQHSAIDAQAAALLALLPGIVVIGWTGWALVATESLPLLYVGIGFLASRNDIPGLIQQRVGRRKASKMSPHGIYAEKA
jgi:hypothetical protein